VDLHTHYDGQAVWDSHLAPSALHGVTTAVMGNCGVGFAPVRAGDHDTLIELMEGVEDIPGPVLHQGLEFRWESFAEYLDVLDAKPRDVDICALVPHAAMRVYTMGKRALALEPANQGDIAAMRAIVADAVRAGAFGFSTSRTISHKTLKGDFTPTLRAQEDELTGIALGMRDVGAGFLELVSDWNEPDPATEFALVRRVVERSGRPVLFSLTAGTTAPRLGGSCWRCPTKRRRRAFPSGRCSRRGRSASCSASRAARTRSAARRATRPSRTCRSPTVSPRCATPRCARASSPKTG
jgi:N-acyl-D-aspartate/D-glutamate deacylase